MCFGGPDGTGQSFGPQAGVEAATQLCAAAGHPALVSAADAGKDNPRVAGLAQEGGLKGAQTLKSRNALGAFCRTGMPPPVDRNFVAAPVISADFLPDLHTL